MPESDSAAVHVQFLERNSKLFHHRKSLRGKCLVQLDQVHVFEFESRFFQREF